MTIVGTCHLRDGLTIRNLGLDILNLDLLVVLHTPFQGAQVELSLTMNDDLAKLFRLLYNPCGVFLTHLGQGHHHLLGLGLVDGLDGARILRIRILDEVVAPLAVLAVEGIACLHVLQFHGTADITSLELVYRDTVGTCTCIDGADALLRTTVRVGQVVATLHSATHHLEILYLTDMRLYACLEEIERCRTCGIGSDLLATGVAYLRHLAHERNNIAQELHQTAHTHILACADAEHGEDRTGYQTLADTFAHLVLSEALALEEFLHQCIIVGCSSLYEGSVQLLCFLHLVGRNLLNDRSTAFGLP